MQASALQFEFRQPSGLRKKYLDSSNARVIRQPKIAPFDFLNLDAVIKSYVSGPEIQWNPSYATFQSRIDMLSKLQFSRPQSVPPAFPEIVQAPWVWDGGDFENTQEYIFQLERRDIEEIEDALGYFKSKPSFA